MKTDEAPEKIYVHRSLHLGLLTASQINITGSDAEYIRTDAFIEKACLWLKEKAYFYVNDYTGSLYEDMLIDDFKNYMKGE